MKEFWDNRYKAEDYVFGEFPNLFFKETIDDIDFKGNILFPAEGEGRNAVYAAKLGHSALAYDISSEGKNKALKLAKEENVSIEYLVGNLSELNLQEESFDAAALIYAHFPPNLRGQLHKEIGNLIKPGGLIILEGFSVNNLKYREQNPNIGGPGNKEMLFTNEIIMGDFNEFEIVSLEEVETELNEGSLHIGLAKVIRFVGKKV